ncbi:hypothetical protein LCGC14_1068550 [marine sediment metagenome]|uniref:Tetratricopeptide repeat protein n=1 Tax=marine sediment metagenome TaxID=412755 RepID=A0A0F9MJ12_9ZZZZ
MTRNIIPNEIPPQIWGERRYEDIILYALGNFGALEREEFINGPENPNRMNKNTFHKWVKVLKQEGWVEVNKSGKKSVYILTSLGQDELLRRLKIYKLDFETVNKIEQKRIKNYIDSISKFFKKNKIFKSEIKLEFLKLANEITYDKFKGMFTLKKFNTLSLFLVLNHPKFYKAYDISIEEFLKKYNNFLEQEITKADLLFFIQKVVSENLYNIKFFQLSLEEDEKILYFRSNSEFGVIFETIINSRLRDLYNASNLIGNYPNDFHLKFTYETILDNLIKKHRLFHRDLEDSLYYLLDDYIKDIKDEIHRKGVLSPSDLIKLSHLSLRSPIKVKDSQFFTLKENELIVNEIKFSFLEKEYLDSSNESLLNSYDFLFKEKDYDRALEEIDKAIEQVKDSSEIFYLKFLILMVLNNFEKAEEFINKVIELEPTNILYYSDKIYNFIFLKQFQKISDVYNEVLDVKLDDSEFCIFVITSLIEYEQFEQIETLKKQEKLDLKNFTNDEFSEIDFAFRALISNQENYEKVLEIIDKQLSILEESSPQLFEYKVDALIGMKLYDEALNILDEAIEEWPEYPETGFINYNFAEMKEHNVPYELMMQETMQIIDDKIDKHSGIPQYKFYRMKADLLRRLGKYKEALKLVDKIIRLNPEILKAYTIKSLIFIELKEFNKALALIERVFRMETDDPHFRSDTDSLKELILHSIMKLTEESPDKLKYYQVYGKFLIIFEEYEKAIIAFEKIFSLKPNLFTRFNSYINIGKSYYEIGLKEIALNNLSYAKQLAEKEQNNSLIIKANEFISNIK